MKIYERSQENGLVTFDDLELYESLMKARLEKKVDKDTEGNKQLSDNNFDDTYKQKLDDLQTTLDTLKQQITQETNQAIEKAKSEVQVKAGETEPQDAPDNTVWFDSKNKLIKVKLAGVWTPMGAVYQ